MKQYTLFSDEYFMQIALEEANKAYQNNEVPIGAILVIDNRIIARAYNQTETLQDTTAHAEILAITTATNFLGSKYLQDATLYVTVEPCIMCTGAIFWSKISRLVYATNDEKIGYKKFENVLNKNNLSLQHPKLKVKSAVLQDEAQKLMRDFFDKRRKF
ncbi:MAG: nucleoside deaminase [Bacteroidota bacterium]|nr:nucleoside deaminase [Bacteroidota bacterium]